MLKYIFSFSIILIPVFVVGQRISGTIVDSQSGTPLPYANIILSGYAKGVSSGQNGFFELNMENLNKVDTVVISHIGYKSVRLNIYELNNTIRLTQEPIELEEVFIRPRNGSHKRYITNKFSKKVCSILYSTEPLDSLGSVWVPFRENEPTIEAVYFPYIKDYENKYQIKGVRICLSNFNNNRPATCRLRIYKTNHDKTPGKDLLQESLYIKIDNRGTDIIDIDLSKYQLSINESGVFVGVELLLIPENTEVVQINDTHTTLYSPFLNYFPTHNTGDGWIYTKGKWMQYDRKVPDFVGKKEKELYYRPAISLLLF